MEREEANLVLEKIKGDYGMKFIESVLNMPERTQDMMCAAAMVLTIDQFYDLTSRNKSEGAT